MGLGKLGKIAVTKAVRFGNGTCRKGLVKSMKTNPFHKATKPLKEIKITKLTENEIIKLTDNEKTTKSLKKIIPSKLSKNKIITKWLTFNVSFHSCHLIDKWHFSQLTDNCV